MFGLFQKLFNRKYKKVNKSICQQANKPHHRRTKEVYDVLDRVYFAGATYDYLNEQIKEITGKNCSRKLISKWKLIRGYR